MRKLRGINNYTCISGTSISDALEKINLNESGIVFIVDDAGCLLGCMSDGDLRRALRSSENFSLENAVDTLMVRDCHVLEQHDVLNRKSITFPRGVKIIPVLDSLGRIDYLLTDQHPSLVLGSFAITSHSPSFIIAEIGNNHQGDIEIAKALVDAAIDAQVDCVKFQMRDSTALYGSKILKDDSADLGAQYTMDLLNKFQLSNEELFEVFDYCKKEVLPLCTAWDTQSLAELEKYMAA